MNYSRYLLLITLAALAACSADPEPDQASAPSSAQAPQPASVAADDPVAKMARAVGSNKPGAAVELRYEMVSKPAVGTPTQMEIALIPNAGVESLTATIGGMEGVTLAGDLEVSFSPVEQGKPYTHTFSVLPDRAGVYYLTVSVASQMAGTSMGRTFSIPLVVGEVQAQQKAQAAPPKDATGQPIQSMRAEEEG